MKPLGVDASAEIRRGFHVLLATTALVAHRGGLGLRSRRRRPWVAGLADFSARDRH